MVESMNGAFAQAHYASQAGHDPLAGARRTGAARIASAWTFRASRPTILRWRPTTASRGARGTNRTVAQGMAKNKPKKTESDGSKTVARNRRARHEYEILETIEAGIALTGTEVKSLRAGKASLEESYARLERNELWLIAADIPEYAMGNLMNHEPKRKRKLLLHRREIEKFARGTNEQGFTLIPLKLYFRKGRAKVELAIGKGKKLHDKRETLKERTAQREIRGAIGARRPR